MHVKVLGLIGIAVASAIAAPRVAFGQMTAQGLRERGQQLAVLEAVEAGMHTEKQFRATHTFLTAASGEEKWRRIPWEPDLWQGRIRAAEEGKPLFIWAMNGDPLGCV
jgi:hypothetical protein